MATNAPAGNPADPAPAPAQPNGVKENGAAAVIPLPDSKAPTRKDASLKDFLNKMDDYAPIVRLPAAALSSPRRPDADRCSRRFPTR